MSALIGVGRVSGELKMMLCYNKHMRNRKVRSGFTLIELSLSIVFIAVLSIAVTVIVMNSISSYHRGIILNQINTTGMEIVDDMRAAIQNSTARSVKNECANIYTDGIGASTMQKNCENDAGHNFISVTKKASVTLGNKNLSDVPVYGAFCTGAYSYIWNSGYFFAGSGVSVQDGVSKASIKYKEATGSGSSTVKTVSVNKLLKIRDESRAVCISAASADYSAATTGAKSEFDISGEAYDVVEETPFDLLEGSNALAIYELGAAVPAESTSVNNTFYTVSFILGTVQGGVNVMSTGDFCTTPGDMNNSVEAIDYCAINKFNFAAEANGG